MQDISREAERRMVHRLLHHWRDARGDAPFATLDAIYRQPLGDIRAHAFELLIPIGGGEPLFGHVGRVLSDEAGQHCGGRRLSAAPGESMLAHALREYETVLTRRVPIAIGDGYVDASGRSVLFRSVLVPTSSDGVRIDVLFGAANGKVADGGSR